MYIIVLNGYRILQCSRYVPIFPYRDIENECIQSIFYLSFGMDRMTIQMEQVYEVLITNCEKLIVESKRDGKNTFVISQEQFCRWLSVETRCCQATAKDKWRVLEAEGIIVPFGSKKKNAHVITDTLLIVTGYLEKNKKIKKNISEDPEYKGFVPVLKGVTDYE